MYFIEKVKFKEMAPDSYYPKHKILNHCYNLEDALKYVKESAREYMLKQTLKFTDKTVSNSLISNIKTSYSMRSNAANKDVIEIFKEEESVKSGWIGSSIKSFEQRIAYFCYSTYENKMLKGMCMGLSSRGEIEKSEKDCSQSFAPVTNKKKKPVGDKVLVEGHSRVVDELKTNGRYKLLQNHSEMVDIIDEELENLRSNNLIL